MSEQLVTETRVSQAVHTFAEKKEAEEKSKTSAISTSASTVDETDEFEIRRRVFFSGAALARS